MGGSTESVKQEASTIRISQPSHPENQQPGRERNAQGGQEPVLEHNSAKYNDTFV
jgi:hypothetical protein